MNFLAHLYLAGNNPGLIVGNFIADAVKGKAYLNYPAEIANGILLHRYIDTYTDRHPVVDESKKRLRASQGKYAPVVADMFYDHLLAKSWEQYSDIKLPVFSATIYRILKSYKTEMPEKSQFILKHMEAGDWLTNYSSLQGISRALEGMSRRTTFKSNMHNAAQELEKDFKFYMNEFSEFFPELINETVGMTDFRSGNPDINRGRFPHTSTNGRGIPNRKFVIQP